MSKVALDEIDHQILDILLIIQEFHSQTFQNVY